MFPIILPADPARGQAFFRTKVIETISLDNLRDERVLLGIRRDVDYVSKLLFCSLQFATDDRFAAWGGGPFTDPEIAPIAHKIAHGAIEDKSAQAVADRLLVRLGLFERRIWRPEILSLERHGGALYLRAAQVNEPPLRQQLESMAYHFLPWTEVLNTLARRGSLSI